MQWKSRSAISSPPQKRRREPSADVSGPPRRPITRTLVASAQRWVGPRSPPLAADCAVQGAAARQASQARLDGCLPAAAFVAT